MARFPEMKTWLTTEVQLAADGTYVHVLGKELDAAQRPAHLPRIRAIVSRAHDDARARLRRLATGSLDPLPGTAKSDAVDGYPQRLHIQTLKGYFGEILAGLAAEHLHSSDEQRWEVPAHLFRFHLVEFQQLAVMAQTGDGAGIRPGRTGDDCLAFRRDVNGRILAALFCEAKCTADHDADLINKAHEQSSRPNPVPVDLLQLIEVLEDSSDPTAPQWIEGIRQLFWGRPAEGYERQDQITYVAGREPKKAGSKCWIPFDKPHEKYTGGRPLHVFELHLDDVESLIRDVYEVK